MALGDGTGWDETVPSDSTVASNIDDYSRDLRIGIADRMGQEHIHPATSSVGGQHKWITLQALTTFPTLTPSATQVASIHVEVVDTKHELFFRNKDGQETQITSGGDINYAIPAGMIMIWSGSEATIPTGWVLCDGTNSTPDLQNNFVVGAGDTYAVADTGGETEHVLTIAELAAHTHSYTQPSNTNAPADGGGTNYFRTPIAGSVDSAGGDTAHENLPPYYALCYIMKS